MKLLFFILLGLAGSVDLAAPNDPEVAQQVQEDIDACPPTPDWSRFFEKLPKLDRAVTISSPCCGIHGSSHALSVILVVLNSPNSFRM